MIKPKYLLALPLFVALIFLSGCTGGATTTDENSEDLFDKIDIGMTKEEVRAVAGEPERVQKSEGEYAFFGELWYYYYWKGDQYHQLQLAFDEEGKVSNKNLM